MLHLKDVTIRVAGRALFDTASVAVGGSSKAGLVGHNGTGKSTLLRATLGELEVDGGDISIRSRWRVPGIVQDAPSGPASVLETVLATNLERCTLNEKADSGWGSPDIDAYGAPARAATVLAGLGFDADAQDRPVDELSGGMRMRMGLAAALFLQPDLLLLDEPTNHLDLEATLRLESYLVHGGAVSRYEGDLDEYRDLLRDLLREQRNQERQEKRRQKPGQKPDTASAATRLRTEITDIEQELAGLQSQLATATDTGQNALALQGSLDAAQARWLEASIALEDAQTRSRACQNG